MTLDRKTKSYLYFRRCIGFTATHSLHKARTDTTERYGFELNYEHGWNPANDDGVRIVESLSGAGLRLCGFADEILPERIRHKGWFADEDTGEVYRGAVMRLPSRGPIHDRRPRFLAGYRSPSDDGSYYVDCSTLYETEADAARAADRMAERHAERERAYQDAWHAGQRYADRLDEAKDARKARTQLRRDLTATMQAAKAAGLTVPPLICEVLKAQIRTLARQIESAKNEAQNILDDYCHANADAFNDGAGKKVL